MIPFSLFITVPLMELLLAPYLVLFPNAVPKTFLTQKQILAKKASLIKKQELSF
jgi:hypothetical protein